MSKLKAIYGALAAGLVLSVVGCGKSEKNPERQTVTVSQPVGDYNSDRLAVARSVQYMSKYDAVLVRTRENHFWLYVGKLAKKVDALFSADNAASYFTNKKYDIELYDSDGDGRFEGDPLMGKELDFYKEYNHSGEMTSVVWDLQEKMGIRITDNSRGIMEQTSKLTF